MTTFLDARPTDPACAADHDVTGAVALVTGGGRGIGRLVAQTLATHGAAVGVVARSAEQLDESVALIEQAGGRAIAVRADVSDPTALRDATARVRQQLGPIDLLVNNAGILGPIGPAAEVDGDDWWTTMEVNLHGLFVATQLVLPDMIALRRGRIINITSQAGAFRWPTVSAYSVSKAAVIKLTENLAHETSRYGIGVFSVHPGLLPIGLSEEALAGDVAPDSPAGRIRTWAEHELASGGGAEPSAAIELLLRVAAGDADPLTGRHLSVHDDLDQLLDQVDEIRRRDLYVMRPDRLLFT